MGVAAIAGAAGFASSCLGASTAGLGALPPIEGFLLAPCHNTFGFVPGAGSWAFFFAPSLARNFLRRASFSSPYNQFHRCSNVL